MRSNLRFAFIALALALLGPSAAARAERQPLRDVGQGLRSVAEDAWSAVTAPTRMDSQDLARLGGILAIGGVLFAFDEDLGEAAVRNEERGLIGVADDIGDGVKDWGLMGKTWPYYAGLMVVGYAADWQRPVRIGGEILIAQWLGGALRNGAKVALGRRRPNEGRGAYWFEFDGGTSLPSGHAASYFAAVEVLRLHADRWWVTVPLYTTAVSLAIQRMTDEQHWASDVWIGAVSGIAAARFAFHRHEPRPEAESGELTWRIAPLTSPSGQPAVGLGATF